MKKMTKKMVFRKIRKITFKAIFIIIFGLLKIAHKVFCSMIDNLDYIDVGRKIYIKSIFDMDKIKNKIEELFKILNI